VDGLQAEREQGITIDVSIALRDRRAIVHRATRLATNCATATGASTASLAVLLVDARKGILTQTRRAHASSRCSGCVNVRRPQDRPRRFLETVFGDRY
jgi:sulfate adenylyltransferase subunit 1 (EFTu-like GTPase family)